MFVYKNWTWHIQKQSELNFHFQDEMESQNQRTNKSTHTGLIKNRYNSHTWETELALKLL